jgi:phage portal protein BeeE
MGLRDAIRTFFDPLGGERAMVLPDVMGDPFTAPWFNFGGHLYPLGLNQTMPNSKQEEIEQTFEGYVQQAHLANGIIFGCAVAHLRLFSQARFQWQRMSGGRPGDLFGTQDLAILERPEANTVTSDLLTRASLDADYGGNYFATLRKGRIKRMRPTWVDIILGSDQDPGVTAQDLDAEVLGYIYWPGGKRRGGKPVPLLASEVCHYAPLPDPLASYRGMSWVTPIAREVMGDIAMTASKLAFFENGMTPNLVIKRNDSLQSKAFAEWTAMVKAGHQGVANAYKTLFLDAGADATVIGSNMQQMEFKVTQAVGEVRMATAAGVHPVILGLSESLQGAALNSGNFSAARRLYADMWARPSWANLAASMETIVPAPSGARLWYDDRDIPFLAEDQKDAADIQQVKMHSIEAGIRSGFKADDVVKAVEANDMGLLVGKHTGLFSVQLQAPGSTKMPAGEVPGETPVSGNGTGPEVIPKGDVSTKPIAAVGGNGKGP